jgi:hypothetical protein
MAEYFAFLEVMESILWTLMFAGVCSHALMYGFRLLFRQISEIDDCDLGENLFFVEYRFYLIDVNSMIEFLVFVGY